MITWRGMRILIFEMMVFIKQSVISEIETYKR